MPLSRMLVEVAIDISMSLNRSSHGCVGEYFASLQTLRNLTISGLRMIPCSIDEPAYSVDIIIIIDKSVKKAYSGSQR